MTQIGVDITYAATLLKNGELVAIPTETVYGLAANGLNKNAVEEIFRVKGRPSTNPLILHVAEIDQVKTLVQTLYPEAIDLANKFWPGPITMVFPKNKTIPYSTTGGLETVAVRIPNHPLTLDLLRLLDFPLAAPSANLSNRISPTTAKHVYNQLNTKIPYILNGGSCSAGIESTIIGFTNKGPVVYRLGALELSEIEKVIGKISVHPSNQILAPGMFKKHYSPQTPLILTDEVSTILAKNLDKKIGLILFKPSQNYTHPQIKIKYLSTQGSLAEAARNLYSTLHETDEELLDLIVVEKLPDFELGLSINDRLSRAAHIE